LTSIALCGILIVSEVKFMADETKQVASPQNDQTPAGTPAAAPVAQKFEVKDGAMFVDGKKVTYESDLIATKKSLEQRLEQAQTVHNTAIDKAKIDLSEAQSKLAATNAKVQELETAQKKAVAASPEDAAKQAKAIQDAQTAATQAKQETLSLRIKNITLAYPGQVTEEQLKSKTPEQLAAFEEALKAVASSRGGLGPYATLGGGAGGGTGPLTEMDRAKALLAQTPYRGVREPLPK
jgi:hypothetical protein